MRCHQENTLENLFSSSGEKLTMQSNRLNMFYLYTKFQSSSYFIVFIMNFSNFQRRPFWKWWPSWKICTMHSDRLIMFYLYTKFQSSSYFIVFIMNFSNFQRRPFWKWRPSEPPQHVLFIYQVSKLKLFYCIYYEFFKFSKAAILKMVAILKNLYYAFRPPYHVLFISLGESRWS